uniref:SUEL-type lectin domain-containing protein n=1 Tax=Rhabditophanes sp. KR3021 TaxID=114890 RepID=A0AC35TL40_9BILA
MISVFLLLLSILSSTNGKSFNSTQVSLIPKSRPCLETNEVPSTRDIYGSLTCVSEVSGSGVDLLGLYPISAINQVCDNNEPCVTATTNFRNSFVKFKGCGNSMNHFVSDINPPVCFHLF